jgi:hypothetical protein
MHGGRSQLEAAKLVRDWTFVILLSSVILFSVSLRFRVACAIAFMISIFTAIAVSDRNINLPLGFLDGSSQHHVRASVSCVVCKII